ncbi:MAG: methyltransferase [Betaproteobacteria bacterium]
MQPLTSSSPTPDWAAPASTTWRDRWLDWRDARLVHPWFRRWAMAWRLPRALVRRRARSLFDLMAGFVYSQTLLACVRLRLFDHLATGPQTLPRLAALTGVPEAGLERLLRAACSLQLLQQRDTGAYGLGVLGAPLVGDPGIAAMVEHHALLYEDLRDPVALLKADAPTGRMASYWVYANTAQPGVLSDADVAAYSALMSATQPMIAEEVLQAVDLRRHRCLLDVGGGEGRFVQQAAEHAPHLQLMLFDLPAVAERARERLTRAGLGRRCTVHGGDFAQDGLPGGADIISLIRVAFDHPDERVLAVLRAVHTALPPGGTVVLAEPMSGTPGAEPMGEAYFGFYLMAMGRGRPRTPEHLGRLLAAAGFGAVQLMPTRLPLQTRVMVATKTA